MSGNANVFEIIKKWDELEIIQANYKTRGDLERFVNLICKKLTKGMNITTIASELEEDSTDTIEKICEIAKRYEPDYNVEAICEEYIKEKGLFDTDKTLGKSKAAMA